MAWRAVAAQFVAAAIIASAKARKPRFNGPDSIATMATRCTRLTHPARGPWGSRHVKTRTAAGKARLPGGWLVTDFSTEVLISTEITEIFAHFFSV